MKTISIAKARTAGTTLIRASKRVDMNGDKVLSYAELRGAKAKVGAAAAKALNDYAWQYRALIAKDPEINEADARLMMARYPLEDVKASVEQGLKDLATIDTYQGNKRKGVRPNRTDGKVTDTEVKKYARTGGKLQMSAAPLARFTLKLGA